MSPSVSSCFTRPLPSFSGVHNTLQGARKRNPTPNKQAAGSAEFLDEYVPDGVSVFRSSLPTPWRFIERLNWNQATLIAGSVTGKSEGIA